MNIDLGVGEIRLLFCEDPGLGDVTETTMTFLRGWLLHILFFLCAVLGRRSSG